MFNVGLLKDNFFTFLAFKGQSHKKCYVYLLIQLSLMGTFSLQGMKQCVILL